MSLSIGIIGLPNVGKSTLFNALLQKQAALVANYPFATIEPNVGIVDVIDSRLDDLVEIVRKDLGKRVGDREVPERVIPAVVKFVDIAGLVKGAAKGEGLGNQFLSHIRGVDALVHVVRSFEDDNVSRAGSINPEFDVKIVDTELILADIEHLSKRIDADQKKAKRHVKDSFEKLSIYEKYMDILNSGSLASDLDLSEKEENLTKDLNLLTKKPTIYVYNISEDEVINPVEKDISTKNNIFLCAKLESELATLSSEEKKNYLDELGIHISGLDKVVNRCYKLLDLETFFTFNQKETRAWTIKKGTKALKAAGKIHTDFERGFISAEVISIDVLKKIGSWKLAKSKGLIRIEGKSYIVVDGDVIEFRFSV